MKYSFLLAILSSVVLISSCKKENNSQGDNNPQTTEVLNSNVGFETVYDTALAKENINGINNRLEIGDFTLEAGKLHFLFYAVQPTPLQIDPFYSYFRKFIELSTRKSLALPANAGMFPSANLNFGRPEYQYLPYSNILSGTQLSGGGANLKVLLVKNDVNLEFSSSASLGYFNVGYRHFVYNAFSLNGFGNSHGAFSRLNTGSQLGIGGAYTMFYAPVVVENANAVLDVHLDANKTENFYALAINTDSVFVVQYNYSSYGTEIQDPIYTTNKINKIKQAATVSLLDYVNLRHYSLDGNKIAFGIFNKVESIINTYTYDYVSNVLTQNLSNVPISLSNGATALMDVDEQGNVYYIGKSSNSSGVSVYKLSQSATPQLVGADNFLKAGVPGKLKYLNGKVYVGIVAGSGNNVHQVSIVSQQ